MRAREVVMMASEEKVRCHKNIAEVEVVEDNAAYPVRFKARTVDGKLVEVYFSPTDADKIGRKFFEAATMALKFWRGTA